MTLWQREANVSHQLLPSAWRASKRSASRSEKPRLVFEIMAFRGCGLALLPWWTTFSSTLFKWITMDGIFQRCGCGRKFERMIESGSSHIAGGSTQLEWRWKQQQQQQRCLCQTASWSGARCIAKRWNSWQTESCNGTCSTPLQEIVWKRDG